MEEIIKTKNYILEDNIFKTKDDKYLARNALGGIKSIAARILVNGGFKRLDDGSNTAVEYITFLLENDLNVEVLYVLEKLCEE